MIRVASEKDNEKIAQIGQKYAEGTLLGHLTAEQMQRIIDNCQANGIVLIAEKDEKLIGILAGHFIEGFGLGKFFEEVIWFVDNDSRGVGIGLFQRIQELCKEAGCKGISMTAYNNEHYEPVKALYKRTGFQEIESKYYKKLGE